VVLVHVDPAAVLRAAVLKVVDHGDLLRGGSGNACGEIQVAGHAASAHSLGMFVVTDADVAAIRTAFEQRGEFAAAVELRRLFPGVTDNTQARECARTITGWKPLTVKPRPIRRPLPK
jgi:hypothetical protein